MITFPGDPAPSLRLSGAVPSAPWRQGRSRAPPARRPHLASGHPRISPTCLPQGLCIPSPTSLASKITRWELLSQRVSLGFPGGVCVCVLVLNVQIVCINLNFFFFLWNRTRPAPVSTIRQQVQANTPHTSRLQVMHARSYSAAKEILALASSAAGMPCVSSYRTQILGFYSLMLVMQIL